MVTCGFAIAPIYLPFFSFILPPYLAGTTPIPNEPFFANNFTPAGRGLLSLKMLKHLPIEVASIVWLSHIPDL